MPERPPSSVNVADGAELRPLTDADYPLIKALYDHRDNAVVAGSIGVDSVEFVAALRAEPWSAPMVLVQDAEEVGCALVGGADTQNRHGRLIVVAREPRRCTVALGLYLRRLFWSHPLSRIYALVPAALPQTRAYSELFGACGFVHEGCLLRHLMVKGRLHDLDVFGLLRSDFDAWAEQFRPEWVL